MLISVEFFDQLCPSYQKIIKELDDALLDSDQLDNGGMHKYDVIEDFFADYMMPKEYWQCYESLFENEDQYREDINDERHWKEFCQFYYDPTFRQLLTPQPNECFYPELLEYCKVQDINQSVIYFTDKPDFLYPHSHLKKTYQLYESRESSPPSKHLVSVYKKMKEHYQKIKDSEGNVEEWFKNLLEVGDNDFVIHNTEYRLGGNLLDIKLWKIYINYLEAIDPNKMLQTYSKYCRFFLEDSEMKKEYKAKVEKYGPSIVHWNTVFDFEEKAVEENFYDDDTDEEDTQDLSQMSDTVDDTDEEDSVTPPPIDKTVFEKFDQNYQSQTFPFQKPMIEYILVNANSSVWRKLHQTCKFFFTKKPFPICYRLVVKNDDSFFVKEFLLVGQSGAYLRNTWVTTSLCCNFDQSLSIDDFSTSILPRLYRCDAKYISIWHQKLSFDELKFLIGSGNVVNLFLPSVRIRDNQKNEWVNLESIMELLPNIEELLLSNVKVNKSTATILSKQNFNSKISILKLLDIFGETFDTNEFSTFCMQNRDESFFLRMEFKPRQPGINYEYITNFQRLMQESNDLKKTHIEINYTPM